MIGKKFGRLLVLEDVGRSKDRLILYRCLCDCGNEKIIKSRHLKSGITSSCGCYAKEQRRKSLNTVSVGDKYGRLTIISYIGSSGKKSSLWKCKCDCGNEIIQTTNHLTSGNSKSCGCLKNELRGEKSPNWNPEKTMFERQERRRYSAYYKWRASIFEKDNYKCKRCNSKKQLNAHHLMSYSSNPSLRLDINNGITLCKKCHVEFHKLFGYKNNTNDQMKNFLNHIN